LANYELCVGIPCISTPLTVPEALEGLPTKEASALSIGCSPDAFRSDVQSELVKGNRVIVIVDRKNHFAECNLPVFLLTMKTNDVGGSYLELVLSDCSLQANCNKMFLKSGTELLI
jgi:hypothetical protein